MALRRESDTFSRGTSKYRGVTYYPDGYPPPPPSHALTTSDSEGPCSTLRFLVESFAKLICTLHSLPMQHQSWRVLVRCCKAELHFYKFLGPKLAVQFYSGKVGSPRCHPGLQGHHLGNV